MKGWTRRAGLEMKIDPMDRREGEARGIGHQIAKCVLEEGEELPNGQMRR